jgi:hypothetical protein
MQRLEIRQRSDLRKRYPATPVDLVETPLICLIVPGVLGSIASRPALLTGLGRRQELVRMTSRWVARVIAT